MAGSMKFSMDSIYTLCYPVDESAMKVLLSELDLIAPGTVVTRYVAAIIIINNLFRP